MVEIDQNGEAEAPADDEQADAKVDEGIRFESLQAVGEEGEAGVAEGGDGMKDP